MLYCHFSLHLPTGGSSGGDTSSIRTIEDEVDYWATLGSRNKSGATFSGILEPLVSKFQQLSSANEDDIVRIMEDTQDTFTDLWQGNGAEKYPQQRMERLLEVVGQSFAGYVRAKLGSVDIWTDNYAKVVTGVGGEEGIATSHMPTRNLKDNLHEKFPSLFLLFSPYLSGMHTSSSFPLSTTSTNAHPHDRSSTS